MHLPQVFFPLCTLSSKGPGSCWHNTEEPSCGSTLNFEKQAPPFMMSRMSPKTLFSFFESSQMDVCFETFLWSQGLKKAFSSAFPASSGELSYA